MNGVLLARGRSSADLAGGFGWADAVSLSGQIEESFLRRLEALPEETQLFLVVAAAEPGGDPELLWRAARRLGLSLEAGAYAESAGLLEIGVRVRNPHATIYVWAPVPEGFAGSVEYCEHVLERAGVVLSPGGIYGPAGEGWFRISLTTPDERLLEAIDRLGALAP